MKSLKKRCSFCGIKHSDEKCKTIVSTDKVGICSDCLVIAMQTILDEADNLRKQVDFLKKKES